ncbi:MAG: hypothetical protein PHD05_09395 [Sphaerochaetaceae bacterium]|nr:hypothetical protein [Sphaerochaetaceae bacterium]
MNENIVLGLSVLVVLLLALNFAVGGFSNTSDTTENSGASSTTVSLFVLDEGSNTANNNVADVSTNGVGGLNE